MRGKRYRLFEITLRSLILTVVFSFPLLVQSQVTPLDTVIAEIDRRHPEMQRYAILTEAYDAYAAGARSWMPPALGVGLWMVPYNFQKNMGMFMISAEQMIPNPKKQQAKEDFLLGRSSVVRENLQTTRNLLIAEARENYYRGVVLREKQTVLRESRALLEFLLEVSEMRYTYQQETLDNIYRTEANLYKLQSEDIMLESQLRQAVIILNTLMNYERERPLVLDTLTDPSEFTVTLPEITSYDTLRSELRAIDQKIRLMVLEQEMEYSGRLPDFGIRADHMQAFGDMPNQFSLMGMITLPVVPWSAREYKANREGLRLEIEAMEREKEAMALEISGMIEGIATEVDAARRQLELFEERIIPALEKSLEAARISYEENTAGLHAVLEAWETLQMTKMQALDLKQEILDLRVEYEREIELPNALSR